MGPYLNIDCDFFYGTADDLSLQPRKVLIEDMNAFSDRIPAVPSSPFLCLDHHELLSHWDASKKRIGLCVHFDAHSDLFTDFNRAWEMPLGVRGSFVGVGDYLFHALREGILENLVWVCPQWLNARNELAKLRRVLGPLLGTRVSVVNYRDWAWRLPPPSGICLCLSPEWCRQQDLSTFSALAMRLGSDERDRKKWLDNANRRYEDLASGVDPLSLRFTFPNQSKT